MRRVMNWKQIKGNWNQMKGEVRSKWGEFTDDDLLKVAGDKDKLIGMIQERYAGSARRRLSARSKRRCHDRIAIELRRK